MISVLQLSVSSHQSILESFSTMTNLFKDSELELRNSTYSLTTEFCPLSLQHLSLFPTSHGVLKDRLLPSIFMLGFLP